MRILFAAPGYKPAWRIGGPVVSVSALAEELVQRGHEVIVFATNSNFDETLDVVPNRPHTVDGVQVWYFERVEPIKKVLGRVSYLSKSIGTLYAPGMAEMLERMTPTVDVVHTHLPFVYPTAAAARAALRHRRPLFYHQRGVFDPERLRFRSFKKKIYLQFVELPILRRATTLFALTEAEIDSYRRLGIHTECKLIPNGIHLSPTLDTYELVEAWGIRREHVVVLFMARIHPVKGADKLVDAFLKIARIYPSAMLVMAGPDEFGLVESLKSRAAASGLTERVIFPGMVSGELKQQLLSRADLFCLPSDAEGFSMAILEALAASTPVLISPGCHFDEVAGAGAGVIAEATADAFASALAGLLGDRSRLRVMGQAGRELVKQRYTWPRIAEEVEAAYEEGIQRGLSREQGGLALR